MATEGHGEEEQMKELNAAARLRPRTPASSEDHAEPSLDRGSEPQSSTHIPSFAAPVSVKTAVPDLFTFLIPPVSVPS